MSVSRNCGITYSIRQGGQMKKFSRINEAGRSMIEAIGYISVMITISVAMAAAVNSGYYKFRLSRINQELTDLKKVISQRYVAAENYKEVDMETLIEEKIAPWDTRDGTHSFSGDVKIGSGDEQGNTFYIEFDGVPREACVELGMRLWLVNDGTDLDLLKINNKTYAWKFSNSVDDSDYELPAKAADVAEGCTKDYGNDMIWYFN